MLNMLDINLFITNIKSALQYEAVHKHEIIFTNLLSFIVGIRKTRNDSILILLV